MTVFILILIVLAVIAVVSPRFVFSLCAVALMGIVYSFYLIYSGSLLLGALQLAITAATVYTLYKLVLRAAEETIDPQREIIPGIIAAIFIVAAMAVTYPFFNYMPRTIVFVRHMRSIDIGAELLVVLVVFAGAGAILKNKGK